MSEEVRINLVKVIALLERESETSWALFFNNALKSFDNGDWKECARIILSGFGGMGSLSDLVLGQRKDETGQFTWKDGYIANNEEFQHLLGKLVDFAMEVRSGKKSLNKHA